MDARKAVDVLRLDLTKAFNAVPHSMFLNMVSAEHWVKNWLDSRA